MSTKLKEWMAVATANEQQTLATLARTSRAYMYTVANAGSTKRKASGRRIISADLAGRMARAAADLRLVNPSLPELLRTDLSPTCGDCEYAKRCLSGADHAD